MRSFGLQGRNMTRIPEAAHPRKTETLLEGEQARCGICRETFADPLAWCAHRPWKSVTHRDKCRWPNALRKRGSIWTLKPSCREAVEIAENGPVAEYRIKWPTPTNAPKKTREAGIRAQAKCGPRNHAAYSAAPAAKCRGAA